MVAWFELADVALKMLKYYPRLPTESLPYGFGGLHELARMPPGLLDASLLDKIVNNLTHGTSFLFFFFFFFFIFFFFFFFFFFKVIYFFSLALISHSINFFLEESIQSIELLLFIISLIEDET